MDSAWYTDPRRISATFKLFDQDQDGLISEGDLKRVFPDAPETLPVDIVPRGTQLSALQTVGINEEQFSLLIRAVNSSSITTLE